MKFYIKHLLWSFIFTFSFIKHFILSFYLSNISYVVTRHCYGVLYQTSPLLFDNANGSSYLVCSIPLSYFYLVYLEHEYTWQLLINLLMKMSCHACMYGICTVYFVQRTDLKYTTILFIILYQFANILPVTSNIDRMADVLQFFFIKRLSLNVDSNSTEVCPSMFRW